MFNMNNVIEPRAPNHPCYKYETDRLASFKLWPRAMPTKPWDLAEAGFYYLGMRYNVCYVKLI